MFKQTGSRSRLPVFVPGLMALFFLISGCGTPRHWQVKAEEARIPNAPASRPAPLWTADGAGPEPVAARGDGVGPEFLRWTKPQDGVVALIGGEPLHKSQIFDYLLEQQPNRVKAAVAVLLGNRVIAAESEKFGMTVPDAEIDAWFRQHVEQAKARAMLDYGPGTTFEKWVELTQGQSVAAYEEAVKDRERATRLLARLVRYRALLEDRVELRIISVTQRELALSIRRQIQEGGDFEILARQYSVHPSAERGGLMQPVWRRALNPSLEGPAFALREGEVSDIIIAKDDLGLDRFQIIKIVRQWLGRPATWSAVEREVLAGLQTQALTQDEFLMWQLEVNRLAEIRGF